MARTLKQGGVLLVLSLVCPFASEEPTLRAQSAVALPSGWFSQDIGNPSVDGSASTSSGIITVTGSGTDIGEAHDEFRFVYQPVSGDVDFRVKVESFTFADWTAKAGVMIREQLTGDSANAYAFRFPDGGVSLRSRTATGASASGTNGLQVPSGASRVDPVWLRLVRAGNIFTAYRSYDGVTWTTFGSQTITMAADAYVGLAVTSYDGLASATATFSNLQIISSGSVAQSSTFQTASLEPTAEVSALVAALPAPWRTADIGFSSTVDTASYASGTFTVKGWGSIGSSSEVFPFVYQAVSGDVEIIARVASLQKTTTSSKAGVLIRSTLYSGARQHGFMFASASNGWRFQRRIATNGLSYTTQGPGGGPPGWVRLVREGSLVTAYHSTNGTTWTLVDSDTLPYLPATIYVGLAVPSGTMAAPATATFTNVVVRPYNAGTNAPPTVSLTSPTPSATFTMPTTIALSAAAGDSDGQVMNVKFYAGSTLLGTDTSSPFSYTWSPTTAGIYSLTAVATDNDGSTAKSSVVNVSVNPSNNKVPTVSITSPASGTSLTAPASVTINATAADSDGTISRVNFYYASTFIGSDTTSPYSVAWSKPAAGTYNLTAVAIDNKGGSKTSTAVGITIKPAANQPPSVSITKPLPGAVISLPASITVGANASDPDGTVAQVEFYANSVLIAAADKVSPYSVAWTPAAGTYSLSAQVVDNAGMRRASNAISVTIKAALATTKPTTVVFVPSTNHATSVTSYSVALRRAGYSVTSTPVATRNLGKPAIVSGQISVDISTLVDPLPTGSYYAVVSAIGSGGTSASAPSATFTK